MLSPYFRKYSRAGYSAWDFSHVYNKQNEDIFYKLYQFYFVRGICQPYYIYKPYNKSIFLRIIFFHIFREPDNVDYGTCSKPVLWFLF